MFSSPAGSPVWGTSRPEDAVSSSGTSSASSSAASTNTATVTANDFLQLLVTELKNQDPTANTDPNEFINQLVQVNSLQQLIQINQDLTPTSTTSGSTPGSSMTGSPLGQTAPDACSSTSAATNVSPGNLSSPKNGDSASRITTALRPATQTLAPGSSSSPLDSVLSSLRARAQQAGKSTSTPAR
jgi:flagellar basal-body rod modification protein FlgD